jgi:hypothetical protein
VIFLGPERALHEPIGETKPKVQKFQNLLRKRSIGSENYEFYSIGG